ncbi:MAG: L-threonylcarbamoyladenylate synthase [Caldilineaceae bacterium]
MQFFSIKDPMALPAALARLQANRAIVAPTDTVYGIMCRFDQPQAIDQLYEIKGRPPEKAIPVLIGNTAQLTQVTSLPISPVAQALAEHFWPGPLTIVLPARSTLPAILTAHQPTVGIRLPNHAWLRTLLTESGPLAATSANLSGRSEARTVADVLAQLQERVELVLADDQLDQANQTQAVASTVVAVEDDQHVRILRTGPIAAQVQALLQEEFTISC